VVEPLLANPRSLTARVAAVLGGTAIERPQLTGFLNSDFDPFLNQLFAAGPLTPREAAEALEGQPGFIWLAQEPSPSKVAVPGMEGLSPAVMHGMTATTALPATAPQIEGEIVEVRSGDAGLPAGATVAVGATGCRLERMVRRRSPSPDDAVA
jgi:hypothetical protein